MSVRLLVALCVLTLLSACEREMRRFESPPHDVMAATPTQPPALYAGPQTAPPLGAASLPEPGELARHPNEHNAWAVSQGKRWFRWYNCNGCHSNGGGGMGPPLMDEHWLYGAAPQQVATSIVQGRPNGMPAFGGRIPDDQVAQLVAYVRSMSAQLRSDVAPSRSDALGTTEPENRRERPAPEPPAPQGSR